MCGQRGGRSALRFGGSRQTGLGALGGAPGLGSRGQPEVPRGHGQLNRWNDPEARPDEASRCSGTRPVRVASRAARGPAKRKRRVRRERSGPASGRRPDRSPAIRAIRRNIPLKTETRRAAGRPASSVTREAAGAGFERVRAAGPNRTRKSRASTPVGRRTAGPQPDPIRARCCLRSRCRESLAWRRAGMRLRSESPAGLLARARVLPRPNVCLATCRHRRR